MKSEMETFRERADYHGESIAMKMIGSRSENVFDARRDSPWHVVNAFPLITIIQRRRGNGHLASAEGRGNACPQGRDSI
ncbi:MAG: hypothetical protein A2Z40_04055 [Deltaproteobacteria bacterium RBG_19FT_COMBO_60_16]|nr:MAG: hypothetical protein A2Z40_04055 [Deltaproteobacteria bacterium RBG_19FT_COMBO_60_16]